MKKTLQIYYLLLSTTLLLQTIFTVVSLSQNIGYGQKISFLENKKAALQAQTSQLQKSLAQENALNKLVTKQDGFIAITSTTLINRSSSNLALK